MSEAMTSESIVEAEWLLKGYWSKMRFAFQTEKGAWSDIDVLAYNPEEKHLIISESKVRGPKDIIFAYTIFTKEDYGSIIEYDDDNYLSFLRHLPLLCSDGVIFKNFKKMVNKITVQLVSNYVITEEAKLIAHSCINQKIDNYNLPVNFEFFLDTTLDVIARIIIAEKKSGQGKRYGHPVLDIAREINRYFYPSVRYAGRSKVAVESVKKQAISKFLEAIGSKYV